ncbi:TIR domain-containing adapter molecule 1 [Manis pentadactyla]|uniref:TIR domain-containing adapter molecule 1 n=1 Tax=Manis pentadactyla TaxID=143292 RepID=UPI00255C57FC|nr:TIR domain-containing adapter molecule 1 [Manis pentadactyla]
MACTGPSLSGAFDILAAAGQDKLVYLKHKLKALRPGCRGADLLHAMVLLSLGQETEARISLEALKGDAAARFVACQWAGMDSTEAPEGPPDLSWAVARVYHLLTEEKLCPAPLRDVAYQAALRAFSSRDDHRLRELQEEAQARCGWSITADPGSFRPLRSDSGCLPPSLASPSGTRSVPRPIEPLSGWSRGCPLRSTGSPASLDSNLEISQSPTMPLLSRLRGSHGPSRLCDNPPARPVPQPAHMGFQEPEEMSWPPSGDATSPPLEETASPSMLTSPPAPSLPEVAPDASPTAGPYPSEGLDINTQHPVECPDVPAAAQALPLPSRNTCSDEDQTPLQPPTEDPASPMAQPCPATPAAQKACPPCPSPLTPPLGHPASSAPEPPSLQLESGEQRFYNFVILHARADEHIALRVRERLEALGVPDGATFCEDFQVPGRGELRCLQDAIDHSAFTILLLTASFDCRLSLHQVSQSLMSSLTRQGGQDCVVPFLPLESSLAQLSPDTSSLLTGLVWLDEHSKVFARKVANTFKPQRLRALKATWRREQGVRALQQQRRHLEGERRQAVAWSAAYSAYVQSYQSYLALQTQMENLQLAFGSHVPFPAQVHYGGQEPQGAPPPFPTWPSNQPPPPNPWLPGTPPPAFPQPPAVPQAPTFPQASPVSPRSPGLQPLIIQHAQMVQLGLNNHMWNQRGTQVPEDNTREAEQPSDRA